MPNARPFEAVAAVDLGSNSFHMVVARIVQGELQFVDRLRERVALGAGLDPAKKLTAEAQERALACLARFGERVRGMPAGSVRAVGTSALRMARNAEAFLARAADVLGHPIEIIAGAEEARLIYLGVAHDLADEQSRRLVIDIGGGSTECILGEHFEVLQADSLHMGCVNFSLRFFPGGVITAEAMERARLAARLELRSLEYRYRELGWSECIGASGTVLAVDAITRENRWSEPGITSKTVGKLRKALIAAGRTDALRLPGLQPDRAPVLPGGVAILSALFDGLAIESLQPSLGALREGVLYDLLGRIRHEDLRDQTVRRLGKRYHVDLAQSGRVSRAAATLFAQAATGWDIPLELGTRLLNWSARLHEIGLALSHNGYHKHGAYLVDHSDMPGFSSQDQQTLGALIAGHRRKLPLERFAALPARMRERALRACLILRLAVLLNRSRGHQPVPELVFTPRKNGYEIGTPEGWLAANPLSRADLEEEVARLRDAGLEVVVR